MHGGDGEMLFDSGDETARSRSSRKRVRTRERGGRQLTRGGYTAAALAGAG